LFHSTLIIDLLPLNLLLPGLQEWGTNGPHSISPGDNQHKEALPSHQLEHNSVWFLSFGGLVQKLLGGNLMGMRFISLRVVCLHASRENLWFLLGMLCMRAMMPAKRKWKKKLT